ncbi:RHS repeat-associated core domain-containing protein [Streptomyces sp. 4N509B]|uniref:RHS repeat-associated core domain-containing protein n=1 Tax=Streptomyces sp. 4N509B TaxID=3457413 RepID=UPI003FD240F1
MSAISQVYTNATNFGSAVSGGVDPRTGLFNLQITLGHLVGNRNLGPSVPLELSYSPLTRTDTGFGQGVSLGVTTYDTENRLLTLSTGGQYLVQETATKVVLLQNKLDTVRITKDEDSYRIHHKSGTVEILTGPRNAFSLKVPTALLTPAGRRVSLSWDFTGPLPRLKEIRDETDRLLTAEYHGTSKVTLHVLPDCSERYDVDLRLRNGLLGSVHHFGLGQNEPLVWDFTHTPMGEHEEWGVWITGTSMPGGMSETAHHTHNGHQFPQLAGLSPLPYVHRLVQVSGGEQPVIAASYGYTDTNFLGGHSNESWDTDKDDLYDILTGYSYGSTETRDCRVVTSEGAQGTQTTRTLRHYNHLHLQTTETTQQNACSHHVQTDYYAVVGQPFAQQRPQFQLPRKRTVTWTRPPGSGSGDASRSEVTETTFDEAGNPLTQLDPDGRLTEWAYYPAEGSGSDCPPEPNGFVRLLRSVTRTPAPGTGFDDAPVYRTSYRYEGHTTPDARVSTAVLKSEERQYAGKALLRRETFTYSTSTSPGTEFGRVTGFVETEYPNGENGTSYATTHTFTFSTEGEALDQAHTLATHDGLTTTRSQKRSRFTGRLWSTTDPQANRTTLTYDGLGRSLVRTVNPGTPHEAKETHTYAMGGSTAPFVVTSTDERGNQLRETLDGAGRPILREQKDIDDDGQGTWYTVQTLRYDDQGRASAITALDQVRGGKKTQLTRSFSYDDWGELETTRFDDGAAHVTRADPVTRTTTSQLLGGGAPVSGTEVTTHTLRGEVVSVERRDRGGASVSQRTSKRDGWGRLRSETDELGNTTEYAYDPRGRVVRTTLPDGTSVTRGYAPFSPDDELVTEIAVGGKRYGTQTFDGLGRLKATTSGGRAWSYDYAATGDPFPSSATTPDGVPRTYQYVPQLDNALARLQAGTLTQRFEHEPASGLLRKADESDTSAPGSGARVARDYFPSGRPRKDTTQPTGHPEDTTRTSYTVGGLEQSYTGVDDVVQTTTFDDHGRVSTVADQDMQASLGYDSADRLTTWTAKDSSGHTLTTTLTLDDFGRETQRTITHSQGTSWTLTQTWQKNDLLSGRTLKQGDTTLRKETFTYGARNELTAYSCEGTRPPRDAYGNTLTRQTFTHDGYGNVTSCTTDFVSGEGNDPSCTADLTPGTDTATYRFENADDPCQLTSVEHTHCLYPARTELRYDSAGRLVSGLHYDSAGQLIADGAGHTLSYDPLGRLKSAGPASGTGPASGYGYDPLDRLLTQETDASTSVLSYHGDRLATVTDGERHTRLLQLDAACVAQHRDGAQAETRLLGTDGKRTVLVSATGAQHTEHAYTAYGHRPVSATDDVLGFDGQRTDPVLGWLHLGNGYRAYDPVTMRFTTPDSLSPFGGGGINPYVYCLGDPVNRTDPSGHLSWQAWVGIGIGVASLAFAAFTAGQSIVAAGGVMAAISAASTTSLVLGAVGAVSDVTGIASAALEEVSPQASSILGYISRATGVPGLVRKAVEWPQKIYRMAGRGSKVARDAERTALLKLKAGDDAATSTGFNPTNRFTPTVTPQGKRVWLTNEVATAEDIQPIIRDAMKNKTRLRILSGLHGTEDGTWGRPDRQLYLGSREAARVVAKQLNGSRGPRVAKLTSMEYRNLATVGPKKLKELLLDDVDTIVAPCYSARNAYVRQCLNLPQWRRAPSVDSDINIDDI